MRGLNVRSVRAFPTSLDKRHADNAFVETVWSSFFWYVLTLFLKVSAAAEN